jgi:hypothetical protein
MMSRDVAMKQAVLELLTFKIDYFLKDVVIHLSLRLRRILPSNRIL